MKNPSRTAININRYLHTGNTDLVLDLIDATRQISDIYLIRHLGKPHVNIFLSTVERIQPPIDPVKPLIHRVKAVFRDPGKRINGRINAITKTFL